MPNRDDDAINGLFDRIEDVARNGTPRDREAEALIQQRLRDYPPAPYYMAQTILIQEQTLQQARERIEQLEAGQASQQSGGSWGGDEPQRQPARARGPWDRGAGGDGGFLAGAVQTALGVTGGMLLGSAIAGMFTGQAAADEVQPDQSADDYGDDDSDSDFDIGGDF